MTELEEDIVACIMVEVPEGATGGDVDKIFNAVADAAHEAQPADRNWDVFVHGQSKVGYE